MSEQELENEIVEKGGLPKWRSHKVVRAAQIIGIDPSGSATVTLLFKHPVLPLTVSFLYVNKHEPQIGGYYVLYEDGYESWSPADSFEAGNTLIS